MKILNIRCLNGPNVFHNHGVLLMKLDLENLAETNSADIQDFTGNLLKLFPGLEDHHCSPQRPGGFVERLERGTYFGHIVEHVALELSRLAGIEVFYGKTLYSGEPRVYNVITRFTNEEGMKYLLQVAVRAVESVIHDSKIDLAKEIEIAKELVADTRLGATTLALIEAAEKFNIPWRRIGSNSLIQLGYGKYTKRIQAAVTSNTSLIATELVQEKDLTKQLLYESAVPVPEGIVVNNENSALAALHELTPPLVVKPVDGHHGQGVTMNITQAQDLKKAFELAQKYSSRVIIEEMCRGKDYRALVVQHKLIAVAEREPAHVYGDGRLTIAQLIEIENQDPRRGEGHEKSLTKIQIDTQLEEELAKKGFTLHSIPEDGVKVTLRGAANLSTGGVARDVTARVHPLIRQMCERVSRIVDLDICGIDLIHNDIAEPPNDFTGVIEVNAGPGLRMHQNPSEGDAQPAAEKIIESLYPPGTPSRIPIIAITGTNGKTTVARLVAKIFSKAKYRVGLTTSDGISIDDECVEKGDNTGPRSSRLVLSDPTVEIAILEVARGGLLRGGLAYDWSDVGVVTNIRPDHFGQDGIEDIEDLVRIKSLIPERVREGGTIVLNLDDRETARLVDRPAIKRLDRKIIYYSMNPDFPDHRTRIQMAERALIYRNGWIIDVRHGQEFPVLPVTEISITMGGTALFQISNALAGAAAALALGASIESVRDGLRSFRAGTDNLGRLNLYEIRGGYVLLDYAHNPDAIAAIARMVQNWHGYKTTAVLGLPGDREIRLIEESARIAAHGFDRLILRDDLDLRGRARGEIPNKIAEIVQKEVPGPGPEVILNELEAIEHALNRIEENEVVVIFYDKYDPVLSVIRRYDPIPVEKLPRISEIEPKLTPSTETPLAPTLTSPLS